MDKDTSRRLFWLLIEAGLLKVIGPVSAGTLLVALGIHAYSDEPQFQRWLGRLRLSSLMLLCSTKVAGAMLCVTVAVDWWFQTNSPFWKHFAYLALVPAGYWGAKQLLDRAQRWRVAQAGAIGVVSLVLLVVWFLTIPPALEAKRARRTAATTTMVSPAPPPSNAAPLEAPNEISPEQQAPGSGTQLSAEGASGDAPPTQKAGPGMPLLGVFERYPGQWPGYTNADVVRLDQSLQFTMKVGQTQTLFPVVAAASAPLTNVMFNLYIPLAFKVRPSRVWPLADTQGEWGRYTAYIATVNPRQGVTPAEGIYFTATSDRQFTFRWVVSAAQGEPVVGAFPITVTP